jgi:hypothetical protein
MFIYYKNKKLKDCQPKADEPLAHKITKLQNFKIVKIYKIRLLRYTKIKQEVDTRGQRSEIRGQQRYGGQRSVRQLPDLRRRRISLWLKRSELRNQQVGVNCIL